jgi:glycosyltransferase involved in cell wall biosynthesis
MKNIWILNHYANLGYGRHYKFAENLTVRGYNVKLFAASTIHNINKNRITNSEKYIINQENGIQCIYIKATNYIGNGKARLKNMMDYTTRLITISKKFDSDKPDIILASSVHPLTWISGYLLSKRYDAKFIAETRDLWPETLIAMGQISRDSIPAKILYKLEKFIYKKADSLIFTLPGGKDYVESIGLDNSKARYINNGIDIKEFNENKEKNIYEDKDLNDKDTFKILYTGSMGQANELIYLIKSAEKIKGKRIDNIKFILFGDGYKRKELEQYAEEKGLDNVIFKGRVEKKYIPNILSKSNLNVILAQPIYLYNYGLSPNKMFDYFASGKPTVSNIECGYDMLEKYNCGITVKGGSAESLAEGILKFYYMPEQEYNIYCQNALNAAEDFDFKVLTDKLEDIILEVSQSNEEESVNANTTN